MIAWLELCWKPRTPMIVYVCISVLAVLVFLSLTGSAGKSRSR